MNKAAREALILILVK